MDAQQFQITQLNDDLKILQLAIWDNFFLVQLFFSVKHTVKTAVVSMTCSDIIWNSFSKVLLSRIYQNKNEMC